jgi:hypothetical protein
VNQFCARCGAPFAPDVNMEFSTTQVLCVECGLSLEDPPEILPPSESDDDQIAYELAEWPPEDRTIATADLVEMGILYRWEDNCVLVVPASAEAEVDAILDEIDENAMADEAGGLDVAEFPGDDGEDGGEEAAEAMSDLFIAADGLQHGTYDEQRIVEFMEAAAAVAECLPPYGIEPHVWTRVQKEAAAITTALEKNTDDEATMEAAKALRALLRQYV